MKKFSRKTNIRIIELGLYLLAGVIAGMIIRVIVG